MREPMVTRTIVTTKANVLCVNILEQTTFTQDVTLPRVYKDNKALMKAVSKAVDNDTTKAVMVNSSETLETLYGMTEFEFLQNAKVLPPRGTKAGDTTEEEVAE